MTFTLNSSQSNSFDASDSLVHDELANAIKKALEPIMVQGYRTTDTFLACGSEHGQRLMLQINVHAREIPTLLRTRSVNADSNDPRSGKNRPINDKHVQTIKDYIKERASSGNKWILGPITANVDPKRIKFQKIWGDLYIVEVPRNTSLEITDGQHRKRALSELIESESDDRELIANCTFPVNLVLEGDLDQCQTDFRDMAQTYPIAKSLLVAYGNFGRDAVAKELVQRVGMFRGKTQMIQSTPGSRSKSIYTINYIAKMVSCAFTNNPSHNLLDSFNDEGKILNAAEALSEALNFFFENYKETKPIALSDDISVDRATKFKENSLLGVSIGLEILGRLLYRTFNEDSNTFNTSRIEQICEQIKWFKSDNLWQGTVVKDSKKMLTGRSSVNEAVERALLRLGWPY
jgi:DNA sulfur modification protein DndB